MSYEQQFETITNIIAISGTKDCVKDILYFDICALIIVVTVMISNRYRGLTKGRSNRMFLCILDLSSISILADLLNAVANNYFLPTKFNIILTFIFNLVYFISHGCIATAYFMYCFSTMGIWHLVKKNRCAPFMIYLLTLLSILFNISNIVTKKVFYIDDNCIYVRGDWIVVGYVIFGLITIIGSFVLVKYRSFVNKEKFIVLISMLPANIFALIIQGIWGNVLIEMFMVSLEILAFVIVIQRHDECIDPISGAKKYNAGVKILKNIIRSKTPVSIVLLKFANNKNIRMYLGQQRYYKFIHSTSDFLNDSQADYDIGGELYYLEYGLFAIMTENRDKKNIADLANYLRENYLQPICNEEYELLIDARICVVNCPEDINDYSTLVTFGLTFHMTMPETKDVLYYSDYSNDRAFIIKNELDKILKRGISEKNFEMHYQPIYSVEKKKFVAAEALIRLHDSKYGDIPPSLFIPGAELSGDMYIIGDFIFEEVCKFISENDLSKVGVEYIQINLAPSQCIQVDLIEKIKTYMEKYRISPSEIRFEITETAADFDPTVVNHNVEELYNTGIHFILDNYGVGYSNIKRVTELPLDIVKLDRSMIENMENEEMVIIVEDTIRMLKAMGKKVLIEGVEDKNTAKHFAELGCDYMIGCEYMQGFYFCKALPGIEFMDFVERRNNQREF